MVIGIDGFIEQRTEQLYVCEEYKLFFLTGQANGNGRRAYISARPFHTVDGETRERLMAQARPWTEKDSSVRISAANGILSFYDNCTGTTSTLPWNELDSDVQSRLRVGTPDPWAKYTGGPVVKVSTDIPVAKPLAVRKPGAKTFNL